MTDEEIINGCLEKNRIAQKYLYDKFARKMLGVFLRYPDNQEEEEDILQNGFISVFENLKSFKGLGSFEGWIRKIMLNTALSQIRKNKKYQQNIALDKVEFLLPESNYIGEDFAANDLLKIIQTLNST